MIKSTRACAAALASRADYRSKNQLPLHSRPSTAMKFANTLPWFLSALGISVQAAEGPRDEVSIALVLGDDMWFSDSATAGARSRFPILTDRLFGLRFSRFHTSALCGPSRVALVTGWRSPTQHPKRKACENAGFASSVGVSVRDPSRNRNLLQ